MKLEPIFVPCEGSRYPGHFSRAVLNPDTDAVLFHSAICSMCGKVVVSDSDGTVSNHDRIDILAMLERGDYGPKG